MKPAKSKTGRCTACDYKPVAFEAANCPRGGAPNKMPSLIDQYAGRAMLIGAGWGTLFGAAVGLVNRLSDDVAGYFAGAIGGALLGTLAGLIVGLFLGVIVLIVVDLVGQAIGRPLLPSSRLIVPDTVESHYCILCRQQEVLIEGDECDFCARGAVKRNRDKRSEVVAHRQ